MNAMLTATLPLPPCLQSGTGVAVHRRHRIGAVDVTAAAMDRFNVTLERIGRADLQFDGDRIATAARELHACTLGTAPPACIRQRLLRVKAARTMIADRAWRAPDEACATVRLVAEYVASNDDLIPDTEPRVGRLDDAIVVDAAWPAIAAEVVAYLDFHRLRRLATERGEARIGFDRAAWQQARIIEATLHAHRRAVRAASYVSAAPACFVIH